MALSVKSTTSLNAAGATGGWATLDVSGFAYVSFQLQGSFSGTITFYGSVDGVNFIAMAVMPIAGLIDGTAVTTSTTEGIWTSVRANALTAVRAGYTSYSTGPINITIAATS